MRTELNPEFHAALRDICSFFFIYLGDILTVFDPKADIRLFVDDCHIYRQISNIRHSLTSNKIVNHSDVVGASPVGAAPTTASLST